MFSPSRKHPPLSEMEREAKEKQYHKPIKKDVFYCTLLQLIDYQ
jgi:hypothetical protein